MNAKVILLNRALGHAHHPQKVQDGRGLIGDSRYDPAHGCHSITISLEKYEEVAKTLSARSNVPMQNWEPHFILEPEPELPGPVKEFLTGYEVGRTGGTIKEGESAAWNEGVLFGMLFEPNAHAELMIMREGARMRGEFTTATAVMIAESEDRRASLAGEMAKRARTMLSSLERAYALLKSVEGADVSEILQAVEAGLIGNKSADAEACEPGMGDAKDKTQQITDKENASMEPYANEMAGPCKHEYVQGSSGGFSCMLCGERMPDKELPTIDAKTPYFQLMAVGRNEGIDLTGFKTNAERAEAILAHRAAQAATAAVVA